MNTSSHWIDSTPPAEFPSADHELEVDTIVVGGGVTGVTAAYLLNRAGKAVALLERDRCAHIDTGHTSAHLTAVPDLRLNRLLRTFGKDAARQVWDAGMAAIAKIEELVREERIDCGFRREQGYLHVPPDEDPAPHVEELKKDLAAAEELGIGATYLDSVPLFGTPGLRFEDQACFHPLRYLQALAAKIDGNGSYVLENSEAGDISAGPLVVRAGGHRVRGRYLVLATHTPLQGNAGTLRALSFQTKLGLHTSYVLGGRLPAGSSPTALFWDTKQPYDHLRFESYPDYDYAIFGGEDHKTGQEPHTEGAYRRLEERLRRLYPRILIDHRWSGQIVETADGLPYIGEITPGQFVATGYAGNGLTFGTVAALMAEEASRGAEPRWKKIFDPGRVTLLGGTWTYLRENKDYPLHLLKDRLGKGATDPLESLRPGTGDVFQFESGKVAASRDEHGRITLCSAICPHLGCVVAWNEAERTWDCPCHGSRFHPAGEVISGPAEKPLEKIATIHPRTPSATFLRS